MNPPCAGCKKVVYPTEKLNCLDKIWHKGCFRCKECSLKLTMNTYKGYQKNPYCKAHYPHLTATQVASTVEQDRLKKQSKQQSQVEYHKKFNVEKGSKISVMDDPETMRQKKVSQNQSNVVYANRAGRKAEEEARRPEGEQQHEPEYDPVKELESGSYGGRKQSYDPPAQRKQSYDPPAQTYNPPPQQPAFNPPPQQPAYEPPPQQQSYNEPPPQPDYQQQQEAPPAAAGNLVLFKALYDYAAADSDEVSFNEDDEIEGSIIDDGWIEGTVKRTGQYGMAPRNYFEEI